ncbi:hypothetical protein GCM10010329_33930 [Streptomyces spiroverticillatus]|uniref:Tetratricopeptide repeat protein n=1 Tax=Streptomyces finlayi TaxID=67296 RepID=A0A918WWV9_9ACTN|nr:hypothetical protein [Streptomyces finlayi]GHA08369.1 hypothetical protein GCM10010329_33930 [Streptomyces spiroverticillatus]GHC91380.1 hypothetical protein GCM10010334_26340 [Streptomyces finlayi]
MTSRHNDDGADGQGEAAFARTFGMAVQAYAREDFAAAVGYLRLLDRGGPVPAHLAAAHAALHGTLAARVRSWERCADWYRRSLAPHGPRSPHPVTGLCSVADCQADAASRCGQCDQGCCTAHGVRSDDGAHRCLPCLNVALTHLAQAAVLTGRTDEAVQVLRSWSHDDDPSAARDLLRSLAPGDPSETAEIVGAFPAYGTRAAPLPPSHRVSRQHVCTLALHHALKRGGFTEWERVGRPTARDIDGHASELYGQNAARTARHLAASADHRSAWRLWLRIWQARPFHLESAHGLGVATLRLLTSDALLTEDAHAEATRHSMACWAAVLHSPRYRSAVQEACGEEFTDDVWASAVDSLRTQLTQLYQGWDRERGNSPATSLELRWRMECEAARCWAGLPPAGPPAPAAPDFFCGPLYLDEVGAISTSWEQRMGSVRESISLAGPSAGPGAPELAEFFGPEAVLATLLREGRFQEVIGAVGESGDTGDAAKKILATAFVRRAQEYAKGKRWSEALLDFEQARQAGQDTSRYAADVCRAAVGAGATVRGQIKGEYAQAGFLERGLQLAPGHTELVRNLTAVSLRLAEQAEKKGRREEAERRFRRALELSPGDRQAKDGLARVRGPAAPSSQAPSIPPLPPKPDPSLLRGVPPGVRPAAWLLANIAYQSSLHNARTGDRAKALTEMRVAAAHLDGVPDRRFSGESAEVDVARGLWDQRGRYSALDEASLGTYVDTLLLSLSYHPLEENSELPDVLVLLAGKLLQRRALDEIIALGERCTGVRGDLAEFHDFLAVAHNLRGARHHRAGDQRAAAKDFQTARRLKKAIQKERESPVKPAQEEIPEVDPPEGT